MSQAQDAQERRDRTSTVCFAPRGGMSLMRAM